MMLCPGCANEMYNNDTVVVYDGEAFCSIECLADHVTHNAREELLCEYQKDEYYKNDPRV